MGTQSNGDLERDLEKLTAKIEFALRFLDPISKLKVAHDDQWNYSTQKQIRNNVAHAAIVLRDGIKWYGPDEDKS